MQQEQLSREGMRRDWDRPIAQVKTCPRCGARLFADMDVCYGCLYDFTRSRAQEVTLPDEGPSWAPGEADIASPAPRNVPGALPARMPAAPSSPMQAPPAAREPAPPSIDLGAGPWLEELPLDEGWDALPDETACLGAALPGDGPRLGLLVRTGSMDVTLPVEGCGVTVGRGDDNDIVLHMRTVSRSHLRVVPDGEGVLVCDQGAINLALANGELVEGACHVGIGGCIEVGGARMAVVGLDG